VRLIVEKRKAHPEEEALAALERQHGEHCSIPLGD
jgi:hypothetical protein